MDDHKKARVDYVVQGLTEEKAFGTEAAKTELDAAKKSAIERTCLDMDYKIKVCRRGYAITMIGYVIVIGLMNPSEYSMVGFANMLIIITSDLM